VTLAGTLDRPPRRPGRPNCALERGAAPSRHHGRRPLTFNGTSYPTARSPIPIDTLFTLDPAEAGAVLEPEARPKDLADPADLGCRTDRQRCHRPLVDHLLTDGEAQCDEDQAAGQAAQSRPEIPPRSAYP
jgi:hypothetical protein